MKGLTRSRIVVAGSEAKSRPYLCTLLDHLGHLVVGQTSSGREAVSLARRLSPDLVMMDIELSDISGLEASRQIDNEGLCPIILLSASSDLTLVRKACSISAVQTFLVKPVCEENLQPAIGLAIARHSQMEELVQLSQRKAELET